MREKYNRNFTRIGIQRENVRNFVSTNNRLQKQTSAQTSFICGEIPSKQWLSSQTTTTTATIRTSPCATVTQMSVHWQYYLLADDSHPNGCRAADNGHKLADDHTGQRQLQGFSPLTRFFVADTHSWNTGGKNNTQVCYEWRTVWTAKCRLPVTAVAHVLPTTVLFSSFLQQVGI